MKTVGLLPAAGIGMRLRPFRYAKELLPVAYERLDEATSGLRPRAVSEFAVEILSSAGVKDLYMIIAPWKLEVFNYFGDGSNFGVNVAFLQQEKACGLPAALNLAYPWVKECVVAMAMPDTIVRPRSCMTQLLTMMKESKADLALGVFPTAQAAQLGPVVLERDVVVAVFDKCENPPAQNTWGIAAWTPRFTELMHDELGRAGQTEKEPVLGEFFNTAIRQGLNVRGLEFVDGAFIDIGTPAGIRHCLSTTSQVPDDGARGD